MRKEVVIRRRWYGNVLFVLLSSAFVYIGLYLRQSESTFTQFIAIGCIILFGGGGLFSVIFKMWRPIIAISNEGIRIPHWRGNNFVPWKNVKKFDVVVQRGLAPGLSPGLSYKYQQQHEYIGIFVHNPDGIVRPGKVLQRVNQALTDRGEMPTLIISLKLSFVDIDVVMGFLHIYHNEYKVAHGLPIENITLEGETANA